MKAAVLCLLLACATSVSAASVSVTLKDVPNIDCPGVGSGAAGSYSPRELDASVTNVMNLVTEEFFSAYNNTALAPCDDFVIGYIDGCSQVVAGTNWQLLFEVTCPDQPGAKVNLKAYVFEPLPSSKQPIEITKLGVFPGDLPF